MATQTPTIPELRVNIQTLPMPTPTQLIRIRAEHPEYVQLLLQPDTSTYPGHGFGVLFANAQLADANGAPLNSGTIDLRLRPETVSDAHVMMFHRLSLPFPCSFEIDVNGTYQVDRSTGVSTVVAETISACGFVATALP